MATIYRYDAETNDELFKCGVQVLTSVKLKFLEELVTQENLTVITDLSIQGAETVQFFLTFDDVINWFYFGKGMGTMTVQGLILTGPNKDAGLTTFLNKTLPSLRGQSIDASVGTAVFTGVLTNFSLNLTQDPSPLIAFSLSFAIVDHNIHGKVNNSTTCAYDPATVVRDGGGNIPSNLT